MKKCNHCNTILIKDARFCHHCGAKVFLTNDGNHKHAYEIKYPLHFEDTTSLAPDIKAYFFQALRKRVEEEQAPTKYDDYLDRFYHSDFGHRFDVRLGQLAEEAYLIHAKQDGQIQHKVDHLLAKNFSQLLDHFIIRYCYDLNVHDLPEKILAYHDATRASVSLQTMILDFLDLENENETYFVDFVVMPIQKLKNASKAFLFPDKDEKIMLITDQTIFGSCKEGFAMTEKGIYWKAHFEKAQRVFYRDLNTVEKEKDWIKINNRFFNVNPALNVKMMKLLRKLKEMY
ncbi:MAG: zinc ribbon domain-containing protein [Bacteroidota bacterium]